MSPPEHRRRAPRLPAGWLSLLLGGLLFPATTARAIEDWDLVLTPYYWVNGIEGEVSVNGNAFDYDPSMFEGSGAGPGGAGVLLEAYHNHFAFALGGEHVLSNFDLPADSDWQTLESNHTRGDLMLGYRQQWTWSNGMKLDLVPLVGVRYRNVQHIAGRPQTAAPETTGTSETTETNGASSGNTGSSTEKMEETENAFEPVVSAKVDWWLSDRWSLGLVADASGFGIGDGAQKDISLTPALRYHLGQEFNLALGYRWRTLDYQRSAGYNRIAFDGEFDGIWAGLSLQFHALGAQQPVPPDRMRGVLDDPMRYMTKGIIHEIPEDADPKKYRFQRWLNKTHDKFNRKLDKWVGDVDELFLKESKAVLPRDRSRFMIGLDMEYQERKGFEFKPKVESSVYVPNLERKVKLLLSTRGADEITGVDTFDEDRGFSMALEKPSSFLGKTRFAAGIRSSSKSLIEPELRASWEPRLVWEDWFFRPMIQGYYRGDLGFGGRAEMAFEYFLQDRFRGVFVPAVHQNEDIPSMEWANSFLLLYQFEGSQWDYHRAFFTSFSVVGTLAESATQYRWDPIVYRAPLYKKWLYFNFGPQLQWNDDQDWDVEPGLRFFIDAFFYGTQDR